MRDPELDDEVSPRRKGGKPCRWLKILGLAFVAWLGASVLGFPGCSRSPYTCAVCRENRVDHWCFGLTWSDREETDCSRWYQSHVEPVHAHCWARRPNCRGYGIPGLYTVYACFAGGPITGLSRTLQLDIYQHFKDPFEAKQLFIRMGQGDYREWDALMEWLGAGYPGTWRAWREAHCAAPIAPTPPSEAPGP